MHEFHLINSFTSSLGRLHSKLDSRDLCTVYGANIKSGRSSYPIDTIFNPYRTNFLWVQLVPLSINKLFVYMKHSICRKVTPRERPESIVSDRKITYWQLGRFITRCNGDTWRRPTSRSTFSTLRVDRSSY